MSGRGPEAAMVLAAGRGTRMRPLTDRMPKCLLEVAGRAILDRLLDALLAAGVERCVVNAHHLAPMVEGRLAARDVPVSELSFEAELLDTGGGVVRALPRLGPGPFFVVNADVLWEEGPGEGALQRLGAGFDAAAMDGLLLVAAKENAVGYDGPGDFHLEPGGRLARRRDGAPAPFVFTGIQVLSPEMFEGAPRGAFSLNVLYDRAIGEGRLHAIVHAGRWFHVGTPEGLSRAEAALGGASRQGVP